MIQPGIANPNLFASRPLIPARPRPLRSGRRPFLRIDGGGVSPVRHASRNLELRCEFAEPAIVRVEQRVRGRWAILFAGESTGTGALLKLPDGGDVRLVVLGSPVGFAELRGA